jgi:hypothetical protein
VTAIKVDPVPEYPGEFYVQIEKTDEQVQVLVSLLRSDGTGAASWAFGLTHDSARRLAESVLEVLE